jgi:hypothetical protein
MNILGMPLAALLGGEAAIDQMAPQGDPIVVPGGVNRPARTASAPIPTFGGSLDNTNLIRERVAAAQAAEEAAQHEGMFGVKGTLRDILGTVGDAFLMQSGMNPLYHMRRKEERLGDALTGMSMNPTAAGERAMGVAPAIGQEILGSVFDQQASAQERMIDAQKAARMGVKDTRDAYQSGAELFGSIIGSLNPDTYEQGKNILGAIKERFGLGDEFTIPDQYDEDLKTMYQYGTMPTSRQISSAQADRRLDQGDTRNQIAARNARSAERRAAMARPRSDSRQEMFQEFSAIPREERTEDQQRFLDSYTSSADRGAGRRNRGGSPAQRPVGAYRSKTDPSKFEIVLPNGSVVQATEAQAKAFVQNQQR